MTGSLMAAKKSHLPLPWPQAQDPSLANSGESLLDCFSCPNPCRPDPPLDLVQSGRTRDRIIAHTRIFPSGDGILVRPVYHGSLHVPVRRERTGSLALRMRREEGWRLASGAVFRSIPCRIVRSGQRAADNSCDGRKGEATSEALTLKQRQPRLGLWCQALLEGGRNGVRGQEHREVALSPSNNKPATVLRRLIPLRRPKARRFSLTCPFALASIPGEQNRYKRECCRRAARVGNGGAKLPLFSSLLAP